MRERRWFGEGRTRALLCLGVLSLFTVAGTMAHWTGDASIDPGTITVGELDLTAGPSSGSEGLGGRGGTYVQANLGIVDLVPGESQAQLVRARNSGDAPLAFTATIHATDSNLISGADGLHVEVSDGSTGAGNSGSPGSRTGTCTGGTVTYHDAPVSTTPTGVVTTPIVVATATVRDLCIRVHLPASAPNSLQGRSTTLALTLHALQVSS